MTVYPIYEPGPYQHGPLTPPNEYLLPSMAHPAQEYNLQSIPNSNKAPAPLAPMTAVKVDGPSLSNPASPSIMHTPSSLTEPATPKEKLDHLVKRKRGRPKNPPQPALTESQRNATGRSKTGCITCRRRKKKCDEAKPTCKNCEKNNIECEGYSEKTYWRSAKQCSCKAQKIVIDFTPSGIPSMYEGLDTPLDAKILDHFANRMSWVLTIHNGSSNHFQDRVLPMAYTHGGLMHGLLALSASHMYQSAKEYPTLERQHHHLSAALRILQDEVGRDRVEDATMALIMVVCLLHVSDGATDGVYRWHLQKFRKFLWDGPRAGQWKQTDQEFAAFIYEFYRYHEIHAMLPKLDETLTQVEDSIAGPLPPYVNLVSPKDSATIGVLDGFDKFIIKSKAIRKRVRERKNASMMPPVDNMARHMGLDLEQALKEWDSGQDKETARWYLAETYRHSSWIVLYRTMSAPGPNSKLSSMLDETFEYVRHIPESDPCQAFLVAPVFRLGCSAFEPKHRERVQHFLNVIRSYSGMGNVGRAIEVLERLWRLIDAQDPMGWDPEVLMGEMSYDFLIT